MGQRRVAVAEHPKTQGDLCTDGVEIYVMSFFCDGELGQAHGQHPVGPPDEQRQGATGGMTSMVPVASSTWFAMTTELFG